MLKTNSKQVREQVRKHIIDCYNDSASDYGYKPTEDFKTISTEIYNLFLEEQSPKGNLQEEFYKWLCGIPEFDLIIGYDCHKLLSEWLQETKEEQERFSNADAEKRLAYLIYMEINKNIDR